MILKSGQKKKKKRRDFSDNPLQDPSTLFTIPLVTILPYKAYFQHGTPLECDYQ